MDEETVSIETVLNKIRSKILDALITNNTVQAVELSGAYR